MEIIHISETSNITSTQKILQESPHKFSKLSTKMINHLLNSIKTLQECFTHCLNFWDPHVSNFMTTLMPYLNKCCSKPTNTILRVCYSYFNQSEMLLFGLLKTMNLLNKDCKHKLWIISRSLLPETVIY